MRLSILIAIRTFVALSIIQVAQAEESGEDLERKVKSAYIFKFGNYVTWPEKSFIDASSPIIIGIVNDELIAQELEKIATERKLANRPVVIKKFTTKDAASEVHILYFHNSATSYLTTYQKTLQLPATLYVTDTVEGLTIGGIINFVRDNNRIRFDVSLPAAVQNNIKLDGSLLTVARHVLKL